MKFYRFADCLVDIDSIESIVVTRHPEFRREFCVRLTTKSGKELISVAPYETRESAFDAMDKIDEEVELLHAMNLQNKERNEISRNSGSGNG